MATKYKMYIGGDWVNSESGKFFDVINPATEKIIAEVPLGTRGDAKKAVDAARDAFDKGTWSNESPGERARILWGLADLVEKNLHSLAKLESTNVGKTIKYSRDSDIPFIVDNLRFFSGAGRILSGLAASEYIDYHQKKRHKVEGMSIIRREPVGVVGAIVPWNYPLYIAVWKIAPALAAGNTMVIKPASYTPLTLLEFAKLVEKAGVPKGVFNVVTGPGEVIGEELAANPKVDMIALTGDTTTGRRIMELASQTVKRVHLELGGKAPFIILKDANLHAAAKGAAVAAFWNTAQDCTAATRVYVYEDQHDEFVKMLVEETERIEIGDPMKEKTDMGPLISARQRDRTENYVQVALQEGAKLVYGGKRPEHLKKGFYYTPTIFTNVHQKMKICQEEIFGPVLAVFKYKAIDEVIHKANDVIYGLAASVWGKDITTLMRIARELKFGTVWINEHGLLASEMPHGGFKQSGFGKDLSLYSLEEYTQLKHVFIDMTGMVKKPWYDVVIS